MKDVIKKFLKKNFNHGPFLEHNHFRIHQRNKDSDSALFLGLTSQIFDKAGYSKIFFYLFIFLLFYYCFINLVRNLKMSTNKIIEKNEENSASKAFFNWMVSNLTFKT